MPFGLWAEIGPRNHVLDGVQIPMGRGNFEGKRRPTVKYRDVLLVSCAKTAEPIEMPFGLSIRVHGPKKECIRRGLRS